jgi:hypothetical protein
MLFANIECFSFLCSLNLEKMLQRVSSVLFVSLLLLVYVVTGIGFSRHTCCQGQTRIALLLEETEDCGHMHEAQQTSAEYGVEASGCCHTEVYQFLPDCLAQRGEDVPVWNHFLSFGIHLCPQELALPVWEHSLSLPSDFFPSDGLIVSGDRVQARSGQWRL